MITFTIKIYDRADGFTAWTVKTDGDPSKSSVGENAVASQLADALMKIVKHNDGTKIGGDGIN